MLKSLTIIALCLSVSACVSHDPVADPKDAIVVDHIVVMPASTANNNSLSAAANDLSTGKSVLNSLVRNYFMGNDRINILSESQAESYKQGYTNTRDQIKEIGKRLNADAVMTWQISRYEEKDGGDYSVNHPSSVAFSYRLTDIATGQTLCGSKVDKTQDTLTGNLFSAKQFLHHGGKWVPVKQLTKEILDKKLQECRYLSSSTPK